MARPLHPQMPKQSMRYLHNKQLPYPFLVSLFSITILSICLIVFGNLHLTAQGFEAEQLGNSRVANAKIEKTRLLESLCAAHAIDYHNLSNIYIRIFKQERVLELWVQGDIGDSYTKINEYAFCEFSGILGPKQKQGDRQIPEGFYYISKFNPNSNYYLSLGVNYPNPYDEKTSPHPNLGGDIFIHGDCLTIGCVPLTDDKIKEVYMIAVKARNNGQLNIPVHIFPYKFNESSPRIVNFSQERHTSLWNFWQNLEGGYQYFESYRRPPFVHINRDGSYEFY